MIVELVRRRPLWTLVAAGTVIRLALAFAFFGDEDMRVLPGLAETLESDPFGVYQLNVEFRDVWVFRWPYPPLYLVGVALASGLSDLTGLPLHGTGQLPPILADVGIAAAVYTYLGWRGADDRLRVAGAALVMLGPCFIAISGYHGQFDSVAILPAVVALMAWERRPASARAVESGLLVGIGAALKIVPGLLVLPLAAASHSVGEGARLLGAAVAVPVVLFVPFFLADPTGVMNLSHYQGLPGAGGLSLVTDPGRGIDLMTEPRSALFARDNGELGLFIHDNAGAITLLSMVALAVFLFRYRPAPIDGAVLLWLTIYVFSPNFFMQYLVWGLPFFIMAGYLREVAILQFALIPALLIAYLLPFSEAMPAAAIYLPSMILLWGFWALALATLAWRVAARRRSHPLGIQPPLADVTA